MGVTRKQVKLAIAIVEDSRETHVHWADYLRGGGVLEHEMIGDLAYHEECIAEYDVVLDVLRGVFISL